MAEQAEGKVIQVMGPVVDVEFPAGSNCLNIYDAVEVRQDGHTWCWRCSSTWAIRWCAVWPWAPPMGMQRGLPAIGDRRADQGARRPRPLGRVFNVAGRAD